MRDEKLTEGIHPSTTIHPDAHIFCPVETGPGCSIGPNAVLGKAETPSSEQKKIRLGARVTIRSGAVIYPDVEVGDETHFAHNAVVRETCVIGNKCAIGCGCTLEPGVALGDCVRLQPNVTIGPRTRIGDVVFIGPNVVFTDGRLMTGALIAAGELEDDAVEKLDYVSGDGQIVEDHVRIGSGAVILANVRLGANSVVAAGAVVNSDLPPGMVAAGNPARVMPRVRFLPCEKRG